MVPFPFLSFKLSTHPQSADAALGPRAEALSDKSLNPFWPPLKGKSKQPREVMTPLLFKLATVVILIKQLTNFLCRLSGHLSLFKFSVFQLPAGETALVW